MPKIWVQKPTDQPTGVARLIDELRLNLASSDFTEMRMIVAFAKHGPLLRLVQDINRWKAAGRAVRAVFGVDQRGTSRQALEFALCNFRETYVAHVGNRPFSPTFHPKIYLFLGPNRAVAYIGSNNLTVGGTETNLECCIKLDLDLPPDEALNADLLACWDDAVKASVLLDTSLLARLTATGMVLDENQMQRSGSPIAGVAGPPAPGRPTFPGLRVRPPSPIPAGSMRPAPAAVRKVKKVPAPPVAPSPVVFSVGAQALVIQIIPHHNGEVFLSKLAVDQNPAFFGWPFTGQTVPKKPQNPSYPQRIPDPVVDLKVYDASGRLVIRHTPFNLNTVYYEKKSEIRITVPPDVVKGVPEGSIMVMRQGIELTVLDYEIEVYVKGSPQYNEYLGVCNQNMPSGRRAEPRKFGWL
jgi:HKD family nuclease